MKIKGYIGFYAIEFRRYIIIIPKIGYKGFFLVNKIKYNGGF